MSQILTKITPSICVYTLCISQKARNGTQTGILVVRNKEVPGRSSELKQAVGAGNG